MPSPKKKSSKGPLPALGRAANALADRMPTAEKKRRQAQRPKRPGSSSAARG